MHRCTVLVIEGDPQLRRTYQRRLEAGGFFALAADAVTLAEEFLQMVEPCVILADLGPRCGDLGPLVAVLSRHRVPVVAVCDGALPDVPRVATQLGSSFSDEHLWRAVHAYCPRRPPRPSASGA